MDEIEMKKDIIDKIDIMMSIIGKYHKDKTFKDMIPEDKKLLKEILKDEKVNNIIKNSENIKALKVILENI